MGSQGSIEYTRHKYGLKEILDYLWLYLSIKVDKINNLEISIDLNGSSLSLYDVLDSLRFELEVALQKHPRGEKIPSGLNNLLASGHIATKVTLFMYLLICIKTGMPYMMEDMGLPKIQEFIDHDCCFKPYYFLKVNDGDGKYFIRYDNIINACSKMNTSLYLDDEKIQINIDETIREYSTMGRSTDATRKGEQSLSLQEKQYIILLATIFNFFLNQRLNNLPGVEGIRPITNIELDLNSILSRIMGSRDQINNEGIICDNGKGQNSIVPMGEIILKTLETLKKSFNDNKDLEKVIKFLNS